MKLILSIALCLFATIPIASAQEDTVSVTTIFGHQFSFGATKRDVFVRPQILRDVDTATCDAEAAAIEADYQAIEAVGKARVNAQSWVLASGALCSTTIKVVPSQSVTVLDVCQLTYDKASALSPSDQILAACGL